VKESNGKMVGTVSSAENKSFVSFKTVSFSICLACFEGLQILDGDKAGFLPKLVALL
jgi:hypothetical protein